MFKHHAKQIYLDSWIAAIHCFENAIASRTGSGPAPCLGLSKKAINLRLSDFCLLLWPVGIDVQIPDCRVKIVRPGLRGEPQWASEWLGPVPAMDYESIQSMWLEWEEGICYKGNKCKKTVPLSKLEQELFLGAGTSNKSYNIILLMRKLLRMIGQ